MSSIKPEIDPSLDAIVLECLEKDVNERAQGIKQISVDLKRYKRESSRQRVSRVTAARPAYQASAVPSFQGLPAEQIKVSNKTKWLLPWIIAGACFIGLLALAWIHFREIKQANLAITANILAPEGFKYFNDYDGGHIALSSDGSLLAFVAADSSGKASLWVQSIRTGITQRLGGTDGATYPFWSPDNRLIGFFTDGNLKTILATGGPVTVVCPAVSGRGGTWNSSGVILFSPMFDQTGIYRVSAAGGEAIPVTRVDTSRNETDHRWPLFLPDGKHFLYVTQAATRSGGDFRGAVYVSDLDSSVDKLLVKVSSNVYYLNSQLLYVRQGVIVAQAFDVSSLTLSGEAIPISGNIEYSFDKSRGVFTCSQNGILLYQPGQTTNIQRNLLWFDRSGKRQPLSEPIMTTYAAHLSPDGSKILYDTYDDQTKTNDVWIHDISRGLSTRMTFEKSEDVYPLWSSDGRQIVFTSDRQRHWDLFTKNSNGTEAEVPLVELKADLVATDWSKDGKYLIFQKYNGTSGNDLWYLPMMGDKKPVPFLEGSYEEAAAVFSPDGRWVAYESGESGGRTELFVRPFPSGSGKWQISTNGGRFVRWRYDGLQLYYRSGDGTILAVDVNGTGSTFAVGKSASLFNIPRSADPQLYDVTPDGQRFLVGVIPGSGASPMLKLVTNWDSELAKK